MKHYTITGKNGVTPPPLRGRMTYDEVLRQVNEFLTYNAPKLKAANPDKKIDYFNKHSFYRVTEEN